MKQSNTLPSLYLSDGRFVGFDDDALNVINKFCNGLVNEIVIFDMSSQDAEHDKNIGIIKEICRIFNVQIIAGGNIKRFEDVKKLLYAGCKKAIISTTYEDYMNALEESFKRFGAEKLAFAFENKDDFDKVDKAVIEKVSILLSKNEFESDYDVINLEKPDKNTQIKAKGLVSSVKWSELKLGADGLIPVIVQDYLSDEVLMLAYMNEEAFLETLKTGMMTYYSRSRAELWTKGLTSGHFQYVKSLSVDCDKDTLLAKVSQVGAACHTGNRSCFYTEIVNNSSDRLNPLKVFESVYDVIADRKVNPKEGSYTNYLFDKGIDKILKKVGEECTEIVIAAKNPDPEEIKYEISDFLYHVMVLMVERGVTWKDITEELSKR